MSNDTVTINGQVHDWEGTSITGPHGVFTGITELNFKSSLKKTRKFGRGSKSIGQSRGNYEASFDMNLYASEFDLLEDALTSGIFTSKFNVAIAIEAEGLSSRDIVLRGLTIDDKEDGVKQGEEETIKLSGTLDMIERNGKPEYE